MTENKLSDKIKSIKPKVKVNVAVLPDGESLNSLLISEDIKGINDLLHKVVEDSRQVTGERQKLKLPKLVVPDITETEEPIQVISEQHITYEGKEAHYHVKGKLSFDQSSLKVLLVIEDKYTKRKYRHRIDLYDFSNVQKICVDLSDKENYDAVNMETDITTFIDHLENYRDKQLTPVTTKQSSKQLVSPELHQQAINILQDPNLLDIIDQLIATAGVVGEEKTRLPLFVMASTYKMEHPIHVLIQGLSGSGKSHLLNTIAALFPPEDVLSMTRITSKSLYHYGEGELMNKLLLIQDFDGLDDDAQFAFREMQSAKRLSSSITNKDRFGNLKAEVKHVQAHFASIVATTRAEIYPDNMNRSVIVGVDESEGQTRKILTHQNRITAGLVDKEEVEQSQELLRCIMRLLSSKPVVNHYADQVMIPLEAKSIRRLNNQFQSMVAQVTLLHQYQREVDEKGRLIASPEDLTKAVELFTESIYLKIDELDSSTRQFFEQLKQFVKLQVNGSTQRFTLRDIRLALHINKTQVFRFIETLKSLEYVAIVEGTSNRGYKYAITFWDDAQKIRTKIKEHLSSQIETLQATNTKAYNAGVSKKQTH